MIKTINSDMNINNALIENFVSLQKVLTNLAVKLDSLSDNITKLLELFEASAKSLAEKEAGADNKDIIKKLDNLLEQNKIIAKGLTLMSEREFQHSSFGRRPM
jgi:hypothetical protein